MTDPKYCSYEVLSCDCAKFRYARHDETKPDAWMLYSYRYPQIKRQHIKGRDVDILMVSRRCYSQGKSHIENNVMSKQRRRTEDIDLRDAAILGSFLSLMQDTSAIKRPKDDTVVIEAGAGIQDTHYPLGFDEDYFNDTQLIIGCVSTYVNRKFNLHSGSGDQTIVQMWKDEHPREAKSSR
ncbi:hypothetical protein BT63DRAFT_461269 [Microthyrium microscopicum]|uniref:Uncharacterized protein n=1 Tax=Microthyrium microscopicum TaxID=703497 RepID=A0A6A6TU14_9PEZI|nr:hypothetical protein BT63DRAFT_461269 [Microthyrium microscopicum]